MVIDEAGHAVRVTVHTHHLANAFTQGMSWTTTGHHISHAAVQRKVQHALHDSLALRIAHNGTQIEAMVLSPLGARLHRLMPYKAPPDLSKFLLSPMPGLLVDVAVQPGQKVQAGEKLAVIEAMKMENILFAAQDGVVGKITAGKGDSLAVDQIILEFQ